MPAADADDDGFVTGHDAFTSVTNTRRDRPWLLPSNRKLRHLQGICLRNLALSPASSGTRRKSIDDASLPLSWKTPAKLLARRDLYQLGHSKSSSDLTSPPSKTTPQDSIKPAEDAANGAGQRPSAGKLRRRSTLNWAAASPGVRQKKLEDVIGERMADTWFSLHCEDIEVTVKFWAKSESMQQYQFLVELQLSLRSLQFIGKSLDTFHHPLPPNCVIFYLSDGVYVNFTNVPPSEAAPLFPLRHPRSPNQEVKPTSSYDALMRLSTLDDVIQDALATREKLTTQITDLLTTHSAALSTTQAVSRARDSLASTTRYLASERRHFRLAVKKRAELRASIDARRAAMRQGRDAQLRARQYLDGAAGKLSDSRTLVNRTRESVRGQRRRICEDLMQIFPIDPIPNRPLHFTIAALPLSASLSSATNNPLTTAAALGHVAHLLHLLALYLSTPLPYPLTPHSSTSSVLDPISLMQSSQRSYPLFVTGAVPYRFEYAVFLLNKDVEALLAGLGCKVLDLRHTLPNLKWLMEVLVTGQGEAPGRKRGVVGGLRAAVDGGRSGSEDGTVEGQGKGQVAWANGAA
ncbi:MAG: hypothetical protein M1833_003809 [Piccolia ochrophora]|nr:MAG: hypothetical protein M1833_003809 [Piccolia ochrophora]